jgi:hypothetical protein
VLVQAIDAIEEADRDWDWFAVDPEGKLGHFTTAGMRVLPKTVKQDKEAALRLIDYFFEEAPKSVAYTVRAEAERDAGGWGDDSARSRYLKDFVRMASAGLFSYDTQTLDPNGDYFLVASPVEPLLIDQLPHDIRYLAERTKSPFRFSGLSHISAAGTRGW